jgi:hypothetical protein
MTRHSKSVRLYRLMPTLNQAIVRKRSPATSEAVLPRVSEHCVGDQVRIANLDLLQQSDHRLTVSRRAASSHRSMVPTCDSRSLTVIPARLGLSRSPIGKASHGTNHSASFMSSRPGLIKLYCSAYYFSFYLLAVSWMNEVSVMSRASRIMKRLSLRSLMQ